jgi:hypothetical protein
MDETLYFIKRNWIWMTLCLIFIIFIGLAIATTETVTVRGTVLEHNVTADKSGSRTYSTIVRSDDGFIEEVVGLKTYIVPVGGRVTYEKQRHKPISF